MKNLINTTAKPMATQDRYDELSKMNPLQEEELPLPDEVLKARYERSQTEMGKSVTPAMELNTESFYLPSKDRLYGDVFDGHINLRMFTTKEERIRLSSTVGFLETMVSILNNCVTTTNGVVIDTKLLTEFDFIYLMYKSRIISYGPAYPVTVKCPHCGKSYKYVANLDKLQVHYIDDDFVEPFKIGPLPKSNDILEMRYLRVYDRIEIDKEAREILATDPEYEGDPSYNGNLEHRIVTVNGKELSPFEKKIYVDRLSAYDNQYILHKLDQLKPVGIDIGVEAECEYCHKTSPITLSVTSTFFRPEFDD